MMSGVNELPAYRAFLKAIATGQHADFEAVPLGGGGSSSPILKWPMPQPSRG